MNITEVMNELNEAIALVEEAKAKVDAVAREIGDEAHYIAYGRYGFDTLLGNGNEYNTSLFDIKENLEIEFMPEVWS